MKTKSSGRGRPVSRSTARRCTCTCPECGKGFRQEISVPDHGARIKAIETLLREGLGRVGEAEIVEPKVPESVEELRSLSDTELELMVALGYAEQIRWSSMRETMRSASTSSAGSQRHAQLSRELSPRSADFGARSDFDLTPRCEAPIHGRSRATSG